LNTETQVGIAAAAVTLPPRKRDVGFLFQEESAILNPDTAARLGIEEVPICNGESASTMALAACQEALRRAELDAAQLDVIVDYTTSSSTNSAPKRLSR